MRRIIVGFMAAVILAVLWTQADAALPTYELPRAGKYATDSLSFRKNGTPATRDCLIGTSDKDTTGAIKISGLKEWAITWIYSDAPGPTTSSTWALRCTLQVSLDSTNWHSVSPGRGVWALSASRDTNILQVLKFNAAIDTTVADANEIVFRRIIDTAAFARFVLTVANSADDTVYLRAIEGKVGGE